MRYHPTEDFGLEPWRLQDKYECDEQHPLIMLADWRRAVRDRQTLLGYWEFVHSKILDYQNDLDACNPYNCAEE